MKNKFAIKPVIVLTAICLITAAILGAINYVTAPVIARDEYEKEQAALKEVLPSGEDFTALDLSELKLDERIKAAYSEKNGGYAFRITVKGYKSGLTVLCGVDSDGRVSGATCLSSSETLGKEKTYGTNFIGKSADEVTSVDTIAGATKTTAAYREAIKLALDAFESLTKEVEQ